jgi:hypothetical protein
LCAGPLDNRRFHLFAVRFQKDQVSTVNRHLNRIADNQTLAHVFCPAHDPRPRRKPKLARQQIDHARKQIDAGERRGDVAAILNVNRTTLYRALATQPFEVIL